MHIICSNAGYFNPIPKSRVVQRLAIMYVCEFQVQHTHVAQWPLVWHRLLLCKYCVEMHYTNIIIRQNILVNFCHCRCAPGMGPSAVLV